jgi:hypothetical protein
MVYPQLLHDHYRQTGDRPGCAIQDRCQACDYNFDERKATMLLDDDGGKVSYFGLMRTAHWRKIRMATAGNTQTTRISCGAFWQAKRFT